MTNSQSYIRRHTELSANLVAFCRYLRSFGFGISPLEEADALLALSLLPAFEDRESFRLSLQTVLVKNVRQQQLFNELYREYWQNLEKAIDSKTKEVPEKKNKPKSSQSQKQPSLQSLKDWLFGNQNQDETQLASYSDRESLTQKDFAALGSEDLRQIRELIRKLARSLMNQYRRRYKSSHSHQYLDIKRTIRHNLRQGGEMMQLHYRRKQLRKFRLLMICDVSKSMDLYTQFLIQFMYAFQNNYKQLETFVFSTSLHCITESLKERDLQEVLTKLAEDIPEWSGGTRIGESLNTFVKKFADKLLNQRSIVLILSDGWDTGASELLRESMHYIHKKSSKVIWLNPLAGNPGYEPTALGMQTALPYIDVFASAHNLDSLKKIVPHLNRSRSKKFRFYG